MVNTRSKKGKEKASLSREPPVEEPRVEDSPIEDSSPDEMDEVEEEVQTYDSRFESAKVEAIWRHLIHHVVHQEKSLLVNHDSIGPLLDAHNWRRFVDPLRKINVTWVQEFYANAVANSRESYEQAQRRKHLAVVRGCNVVFTAQAIKEILQLPDQPHCAYSELYDQRRRVSQVPMADVARIIAFEGTDWTGTIIRRSTLTADAHYWYEFIRHWLMPTMNTTEVIRTRGLLVYAIMTRVNIDVVSLIYHSLLDNISSLGSEFVRGQKVKKSPLIYPSLIHTLCEAAGVPRYAGDMEQEPAGEIAWAEKTPGEPAG